MRQAFVLLGVVAGVFAVIDAVFGHHIAIVVAFGSISVMALMIAVTFFWLWRRRETPLALGMSFSWAGAASVLGWWWLFHVLDQPDSMRNGSIIFLFLALYFVGAIQHFRVMQRSMNLGAHALLFPVALAISISISASIAFWV